MDRAALAHAALGHAVEPLVVVGPGLDVDTAREPEPGRVHHVAGLGLEARACLLEEVAAPAGVDHPARRDGCSSAARGSTVTLWSSSPEPSSISCDPVAPEGVDAVLDGRAIEEVVLEDAAVDLVGPGL